MNQLFYFTCGNCSLVEKKVWVCNIKSEENQAGGQRKETGAAVSMPNRQV